MKYFAGIITAVALLLSCEPSEADPIGFRAHEATYLMTQVRQYGRDWSPVERAEGLLRYKFNPACDGWTVEHQTALDLVYENGQQAQMVWNYTSWEAKDGSKLRFRTRTQTNGQETEKLSGEARHEGEQTVVIYSRPSGKRVILPKGTFFPTSHMRESLKRAESGEIVFNAPYFDGSSEDEGFNLDTVMTRFKGKPLAKIEDQSLPKSPTWDMQLAFYQRNSIESVPHMEISARYRKDGVTTHIMQDFGDFVLEGRLVEFSYSKEPSCN